MSPEKTEVIRLTKPKERDLNKVIEQAIRRAFEAGRISAGQAQKDAYKSTERRLYAMPILLAKKAEEEADLERLLRENEPDIVMRSTDIVRFRRTGIRLSDEDLLQAQVTDLRANIAMKEHEIQQIERALEHVKGDYYYRAVPMKYFEGISDDDVAKQLFCDGSTIRRNRSRLVKALSIWLYGPEAI